MSYHVTSKFGRMEFHLLESTASAVICWRQGSLWQGTFDYRFSVLTSKKASSDLRYTVSGRLGVQASDLHEPYPGVYSMLGIDSSSASPVKRKNSGADFRGLPALLIAFGCLVFALTVIAIAYLCVMKRKYADFAHTASHSNLHF